MVYTFWGARIEILFICTGSFVLRQEKKHLSFLSTLFHHLQPHALTFLLPRYRTNWSAVPPSSGCFTGGGFMYRLRDVKVFKSSILALGCTSTADWPSNIMETWIWSYKIIPLKVPCRNGHSAFPWYSMGFPHSLWGLWDLPMTSKPLFTYVLNLLEKGFKEDNTV